MKFEGSKFDNDKGVKEGSKADLARDAKEKKAMAKKKMAMGGVVPAAKTTDKAGVSAKPNPFANMTKQKKPNTGRNQMVMGPGMPRLAKGGKMRGC